MALDLTTSVERLTALVMTAAEATGFPVELDRPTPYNERTNLPLVLVSSGELSPTPQSPQTWARHWTYSPYVEIVASGETPEIARAAVTGAFSRFIDALESQIEANLRAVEQEPLLTPGTYPKINSMPFEVQGNSRARGYVIELALEFLRG